MRRNYWLLLTLLPTFLWAQEQKEIFIYSPNPSAGLHIAENTSNGWTDLGQLCSSDYGTWGAEKKMHAPSVCRANDGTWRLVFQVNDRSPVFAAAYSRNLITWRPQDYPVMGTRHCKEPVIFENPVNGSFDIYYKSSEGKRFVSASADFRHFSKDESSMIDDAAWTRDTATIGGQLMEGNQFTVSNDFLTAIRNHFQMLREDARRSSERMHNDAKTLAWLKEPLTATLTVEPNRQKTISDKLVGIFFEDISYAADGGLYAELVQNRDFEYNRRDRREWHATTAWHSPAAIRIATEKPLSKNNPHYAIVTSDSLWNEGWDGIAVEKGKKYDFSMFVCGQKQFIVMLTANDGTVLAKKKVKSQSNQWQQVNVVLKAKASCEKARLLLLPQGKEEAAIDMVSLFPQETFMGRKNGLRKDLAETIARLKPKFVRFPGGCMSHGQGLDNIYHWNETVGPLQDRKPDMNIWNYHQTRGLGFYEYFQFCEDIGAEPLPVLAAGVPCQNSANNAQGLGGQQGGIPMEDMPAYIEELCNLIEWANGDPATSKWAKMRADAGHPAPFNLKYLGIGNEDIISTVFEERYEMICRGVLAKYPNIKICGTVGPFHTPSADYIEGWDFARKNPTLQYMVDEHYYESTGWFLNHRNYYDNYPRNGVKVYLGEWAASTHVKRPCIESALAEALYMTDLERNADVVVMSSYAPMLAKDGHHNWNPDMIYFSNTEVRPTPAYEVQRLFGNYSGDRYISSEFTVQSSELAAQSSELAVQSSELAAQGAPKDCNIANRLGASVVKDSKTGKTFVKLVNALPVEVRLNVKGLNLTGAHGETFSGKPEDQHLQCQPLTIGNEVTLPPYSFLAVEL